MQAPIFTFEWKNFWKLRFYHLMQSAYKILSYCIYKCNLHPMLVVEIFGTFYNV